MDGSVPGSWSPDPDQRKKNCSETQQKEDLLRTVHQPMPSSQGEGVAPLLPVLKDQEDTAAGSDVHKAAVRHAAE